MTTKDQLMWIITALGGITLVGVFARLRFGLNSENQRIVVVVLVLTFASLLALTSDFAWGVGIGVAGALLGYLLSVAARPKSCGITAEELNAALDGLAQRIRRELGAGPNALQAQGVAGGAGGAQNQTRPATGAQQQQQPVNSGAAEHGGGKTTDAPFVVKGAPQSPLPK